ncbi:MAG TPA: HAD-IA family hydrolase [Bryobacteraceae bacterium]|nr:HAD-IA family hydrolase [Bryobacteraceae bacterium]
MTARGVLAFDMDGVLVDVTESYRETIRRTVQYFTGREIGNDRIQELKNAGGWTNDWSVAHKIIQDLGVAVDYDPVVARFQSIFLGDGENGLMRREKWTARPGLLEDLSGRYRLAVFTGRPRAEAQTTLSRFAAHLTFDPLVAAEDVEHGKPAPDGLAKIAALTTANRIWYVGDTVDDARSARAAGVPFIGIAAPGSPRRADLVALFAAEKALAVIDDINQLETVL